MFKIQIIEEKSYIWVCPYCQGKFTCSSEYAAAAKTHEHMKGCKINPNLKRCGSCVHMRLTVPFCQKQPRAEYYKVVNGEMDCSKWEVIEDLAMYLDKKVKR